MQGRTRNHGFLGFQGFRRAKTQGSIGRYGLTVDRRRDNDSRRGSARQRGYTSAWQKARAAYLAQHPLCVFCERDGRVTAATVVDHIEAHHGDYEKFWNPTTGSRFASAITTAPNSGRRNIVEGGGGSKSPRSFKAGPVPSQNFCVREIGPGGQMTRGEWPADKVERWPLDRLVPYARNARTHDDAQVAQIAASIREWGWTNPVLVDEKGTIIAGHGRVLAARQLGLQEAPVMVARGWSEAQCRAYVLADNKLAENAGWDKQILMLEVADLTDVGLRPLAGRVLGPGADLVFSRTTSRA